MFGSNANLSGMPTINKTNKNIPATLDLNKSLSEFTGEQREKVRINKKALQVADNLFPPMPSIQHSDSNLTRQPHH